MLFAQKPTFNVRYSEQLIPLTFDTVSDRQFYNGFCKVKIGKNWGVIDKTGKEIIPINYSDLRVLSHGLFGLKTGKTWKIVNEKEVDISNVIYEHLYNPSSEIDENLKIVAIVKFGKKIRRN